VAQVRPLPPKVSLVKIVRPRSTILQLLGYELRVTRIGRLAQGILAWVVGARLSHVEWTTSWLILGFGVAGGIALFGGILLLQATLAFWTVESLELANTLTYGGVEAGQYPLDVYTRWFRDFLVYVVPIGCISYFPVSVVLCRASAMPFVFRTMAASHFPTRSASAFAGDATTGVAADRANAPSRSSTVLGAGTMGSSAAPARAQASVQAMAAYRIAGLTRKRGRDVRSPALKGASTPGSHAEAFCASRQGP